MIIDASAIVAIMRREPEASALTTRMVAATSRSTHAVTVYEAALAIARLAGSPVEPARAVVEDFLADMNISVVGLGAADAWAAVEAFSRYGKGRHAAKLNMGDCFSYACAKLRGVPLLYKGDDFELTDLA